MFSFMKSEAIIAKAKNVTRVGSGLFVTHDTDVSARRTGGDPWCRSHFFGLKPAFCLE
jgi:hypothetical protein